MLKEFYLQLLMTSLKHLVLFILVLITWQEDYLHTFLITVALSYVYTNLIAGSAVLAISKKAGEKDV